MPGKLSIDRSKTSADPGISAEALFDRYTSFGDDPFIVTLDGVDRAREVFGLELCGGASPPDVRGSLSAVDRRRREPGAAPHDWTKELDKRPDSRLASR